MKRLILLLIASLMFTGCGLIGDLLEAQANREDDGEGYDPNDDWDEFDPNEGADDSSDPRDSADPADGTSANNPVRFISGESRGTVELPSVELPTLVLIETDSDSNTRETPSPDLDSDRPTDEPEDRGDESDRAEHGVNATCPAGWRYATNDDDMAFCLYEDISAPAAAEAYCDWLQDGYIGYYWAEEDKSGAAHSCPPYSNHATSEIGLDFCLFEDIVLPDSHDIQPYCDWLQDGYIGYQWPLAISGSAGSGGDGEYSCPDGMMQGSYDDGRNVCLFFGLEPPTVSAEAYCDVSSGVLGFSFEASADLVRSDPCPEQFSLYGAGGTELYCLFEDFELPRAEVSALCDWLDEGILGFSWNR